MSLRHKSKPRREPDHPHEKPHHPHWPLACLLFLFVFALGMTSIHDASTWIHIRTGGRILAEHALPRTDPYSYTVAGRAWTTDSWLSDVLFFFVHTNFGPRALIALKAVVAAAGFALLLPLNFASPLTSATVLGLGAVSAWSGLAEIPAVFDLLLVALFIRLLRPRRRFTVSMLLGVAALEWLWANLHGPTAILGVWLVLLKAFKASLRTKEREDRWGHWALLAAVFAAFALNPNGLSVVGHMLSGLETSATAWYPLSPYLNLYNLFAFAGAASCVVMLQQEFFLTLTAATALALSLVDPQMRALAVIACCPVISLALGHYVPPVDDDLVGLARWAGLMAVFLGFHWLSVTVPLGSSRGYGAISLSGATRYLKAAGVQGRMFNDVESGDSLVGAGDRPVFVDSREALYGPAFIRDADRWPWGFKNLADVYSFDYAVVLNRRGRYPAKVLDNDPDWRLAYADDVSLVYVRKTGASGRLVKDEPPAVLHPNELWPSVLDAQLADAKRQPKLSAALDQWLLQAPDSAQALLWKAYALDRRGRSADADRLVEFVSRRRSVGRDPELSAMLAFVLDNRGDSASARSWYRRASLIARRRGDRHLESEVMLKMAASYRRSGDETRALRLEQRAKEVDVPAFAEDI